MDIEIRNECERLVAEQAVLAFREVQAAGAAAAYGHGMAALETATLAAGRRQMKQVLDLAFRSQAEAQKGGHPSDAPVAASGRVTNVRHPKQ